MRVPMHAPLHNSIFPGSLMMSLAGRCDVDCGMRVTWAEVRVVTGAMVATENTLESCEVNPAPSKAHPLLLSASQMADNAAGTLNSCCVNCCCLVRMSADLVPEQMGTDLEPLQQRHRGHLPGVR